MTRWSHGHSLLVGVLLAFALERHTLWVVSVAFVVGLCAARLREIARRLVGRYLDVERRVLAPRPTAKTKRTRDAW